MDALLPSGSRRGFAHTRDILDAAKHQGGPPGLVARAHAAPVVAVEALVKKHELSPVGISGISRFTAVAGAMAARVREEERGQPPLEVARDLGQGEQVPGSAGCSTRTVSP
jgi:hypothetical protein